MPMAAAGPSEPDGATDGANSIMRYSTDAGMHTDVTPRVIDIQIGPPL